jgi:hypothetical protein
MIRYGGHRTAWDGSLSAQPIRPPVNLQKKKSILCWKPWYEKLNDRVRERRGKRRERGEERVREREKKRGGRDRWGMWWRRKRGIELGIGVRIKERIEGGTKEGIVGEIDTGTETEGW